MGSEEPVSPVEGGDDLQTDRGPGPVRIMAWTVAGLVILLTLLLGVTAATLPGCSFCHDSSDFVAQTKAHGHASTDCVRCHVKKDVPARVAYAYNIIFAMALRAVPEGGGPTTAIPDATCLSCHANVMREMVTHNGLSILHSQCGDAAR